MKYKIHNNTIFIEGNKIIGHYLIDKDQAYKIVSHYSGDDLIMPFHKIGSIPINSEAELINKLRDKNII